MSRRERSWRAGGRRRAHPSSALPGASSPKRNTAPEEGQQKAQNHQQCGASAPPPRQPQSAHKGPLCPCRSQAGREWGPGADGRGQSPGGRGWGNQSWSTRGQRGRIETGGGDRESQETQNSRGGSEKGAEGGQSKGSKVRASWGAETGATGFRDAGYLAQPRDERI